jgi:hypothetical protein
LQLPAVIRAVDELDVFPLERMNRPRQPRRRRDDDFGITSRRTDDRIAATGNESD